MALVFWHMLRSDAVREMIRGTEDGLVQHTRKDCLILAQSTLAQNHGHSERRYSSMS
jgi:hypothetical protein